MMPPPPPSDPSTTTAAARRVATLARQVAGGGSAPLPPSIAQPHPVSAVPADAAACPRTAGGPFRADKLLEGQGCE